MKRSKRSHRVIALFLVFSMLPSLVPYNMLQASGNGPTAPEATGFEPVDATDMVNLVTGDFSYVLPLLNVPSPEGGYPLALAYHAGIAMDQEASWTGLGWSLNPGAINRSVNGYPDDYNSSLLTEYFYDQGKKENIYSLSLGFTANSGTSVGLNLSWGSNRSLGGSVSVGYGLPLGGEGSLGGGISVGTDGVGINGGYTTQGGLALGVNAHSSGSYGGSVGFDNNKEGFSVGLSSSGRVSVFGSGNNKSLGINFSSHGMGIYAGGGNTTGNNTMREGGIGIQMAFNNTVSMGDYTVKTSGWMIPIMVPTFMGVFSLSFGKQKIRYYLGKKTNNFINGPLYFNEGTSNGTRWYARCYNPDETPYIYEDGYFDTEQEANNFVSQHAGDDCRITEVAMGEAFMDVYEVPLEGNQIAFINKLELNNPVFPAYDNYNIQAQGISGAMSSQLFENGVLYGLSNRENDKGYILKHALSGASSSLPPHAKFDGKPNFYLDNEVSTYLSVNKANFDNSTPKTNILDHYSDGVKNAPEPRRVTGNYVEYFTNDEIINNAAGTKAKGFLTPLATGFKRGSAPSEGIGAFKITTPDGKTYHYSLPVYNHEIITRTFGIVTERPEEKKSYFEKRQLQPYATHWLLTAVTGPDYVDKNGNGIPDRSDYGYWVAFDYGKWSDAFVWKAPYGEDYFIDEDDANIKTQIRGRKEVYYLDKVITRTHKALFVKEERYDGQSVPWSYKSVAHNGSEQNSNNFQERFNIPVQKPLRLKKIVLVKETNDVAKNSGGAGNAGTVSVHYNNSSKPAQTAGYNMRNNVLDDSDNWSGVIDKSLKSIDFAYTNNLVKGTPNAPANIGRSALIGVHFKGKANTSIIPPYKFNYVSTETAIFDIRDKDNFGYYKDNTMWSLNEITTPQGGKIKIDYQPHRYKTAVPHRFIFRHDNKAYNAYSFSIDGSNRLVFNIKSDIDLGISTGSVFNVSYLSWSECCVSQSEQLFSTSTYKGKAEVIQSLGNNTYKIRGVNGVSHSDISSICNCGMTPDVFATLSAEYVVPDNFSVRGGGPRASAITVTDDFNQYKTQYSYGSNEDGIGYIAYAPYAPELQKELPYSTELPAPKVMYEYVTVKPATGGKIRYKFNVMKEKSPDSVKFEDFYEITKQNNTRENSQNIEVNVSDFVVMDNLTSLGQLMEMEVYNKENHLLNKIVNDYYPRGATPGNLGVTRESYQSYKIVDYIDNHNFQKDKWLINSSSRIKYPSLLRSSTEHRGGHTFKTEFKDLNSITGQAREVETVSSAGDRIRSKAVFAYEEYPKMGSKVTNETYKNMLTQTTASYSQVTANNGDWKTTGVGITTWKAWDNDVWRKHRNYTWKGELDTDGAFKDFSDEFNWSASSQPAGWQMLSEVTRYDVYSNTLEVKDVNGNYASTKWGNNKVFSTSNTTYNTMFFSGAEDVNGNTFSGGVSKDASAAVIPSRAHTGEKSVQVAANVKAFKVTPVISDTYRVSVWADKSNYTNTRVLHNGQNYSYNTGEVVLAGNWVQLNFTVPVTAGKEVALVTSSGTAYYDDFRIHPVSSSMNSYVYNEYDELTHILGPNNMGIKYGYDNGGRLKQVSVEVADNNDISGGFKLMEELDHRYKRDIDKSPYNELMLWLKPDESVRDRILAGASGGSGVFEYRWSQGCNGYSDNYGAWNSSGFFYMFNNCSDIRVYIRCQIKDLFTGEIKTNSQVFIRQ